MCYRAYLRAHLTIGILKIGTDDKSQTNNIKICYYVRQAKPYVRRYILFISRRSLYESVQSLLDYHQ